MQCHLIIQWHLHCYKWKSVNEIIADTSEFLGLERKTDLLQVERKTVQLSCVLLCEDENVPVAYFWTTELPYLNVLHEVI